MKTFIFIPDTNKKAGLGHLSRCYKYSNFVSKNYEIIFLIKKNFNKKFLIKKNLKNRKIRYIFFSNLKTSLDLIKTDYDYIVTFLDTYNSKIRGIDFNKFSNKHVVILDFKTKCKSDFTIDHTFGRNYNYHKNKKILIGVKNFPIYSKLKFKNRDSILINFGSIKSNYLINRALLFLQNLKIDKSLKIIIINKFFTKKKNLVINLKNKIIYYTFVDDIKKIYQRTLFAIGACGISLYEKSFSEIPCISKSVARNQSYNFKNFYAKNCILNFDKVVKLPLPKRYNYESLSSDIVDIEYNLKKYFDYKINKKHLKRLFKKF